MNVHQEGTSSKNHESACTSKWVAHHVAHTHKHKVLYYIFPNEIGEDPMSHNSTPKIYNVHLYNHPCVISSKKWMKNLHQNLNQIRSKENMKTSSVSKKSHQYTHECVYHHEITEDFLTNNNVPQSYIFTQVWDEVPPT